MRTAKVSVDYPAKTYTFILFLFISFFNTSLFTEDMYNKIFCGYQGWFTTYGDDPVNDISWSHWCIQGTEPAPDTVTFDIWPDYTEYDAATLFYSTAYNWEYKNGKSAGFFSSNMEKTIMLHCKWMRDYGIDGVFVQRFTSVLSEPKYLGRMDNVLRYLLKWGEKYGIKVAVMYDITGTLITEISKVVIEDWIHLIKDLKVTSSSAYQYHPDRNDKELPVVGVWGFGFLGQGVKGQAVRIADLFKKNKDSDLHATIVGGVPAYWRTLDRDSKPEYKEIYKLFDIISPWTVGRIANNDDVAKWTDMIRDDIQKAKSRGQEYMPVSFPGFSISNLTRNTSQLSLKYSRINSKYSTIVENNENTKLNLIARAGGNFMWSQLYHWKKTGTDLLYIAMFDEVDEATAIFKLAPKEELSTSPELFLTLNTDGFDLRSDHYLWMTGVLRFMIGSGVEIPEIQPERLDIKSLHVYKNSVAVGNLDAGRVLLNIVLENTGRSFGELYRKPDGENNYLMIKHFDLENRVYTELNFTDESAAKNSEYTYIIFVYDKSGNVIAVSDLARTSYK